MEKAKNLMSHSVNRRALLKNGVLAGAATMGAALLPGAPAAFGREDEDHSPITKGEARRRS